MKWINPSLMTRLGILGMNCRNRDFIGRYNNRNRFPLVDDKLKTKLLAKEHGLAMPKLHFVVSEQHQVSRVEQHLRKFNGFAIKPAKGSGGRGILVVVARNGERFIISSKTEIGIDDIRRHISNTLAGLYSLGGQPDVAIIEGLIEVDDQFARLTYEGVPDIRILVFQGYPVMAMLRLVTHASSGKANLHKGAVGVGLDLATGRALHAVQYSRKITHHPDTGQALNEIEIADWHNMLLLAARCYDITGLGYIGADIVLDKNAGPQLLELNARPGLSIQVANGRGLLPRLRRIESMLKEHRTVLPGYYKVLANHPPHVTPEERVAYVVKTFGHAEATV